MGKEVEEVGITVYWGDKEKKQDQTKKNYIKSNVQEENSFKMCYICIKRPV